MFAAATVLNKILATKKTTKKTAAKKTTKRK
jgi:hypothetical protein